MSSEVVKSKGRKRKIHRRHNRWGSPEEQEQRRVRYDAQEDRELAVKEKNAESLAAFAKAFTVYADAIAAQGSPATYGTNDPIERGKRIAHNAALRASVESGQ